MLNIIIMGVSALMLVLYLVRRRARLSNEDV